MADENDVRALSARLTTGPKFLLLGQASVPAEARLKRPDLLDPNTLNSSNYEDYDNACGEFDLSPAEEALFAVPWNGVFTSRIDSHLPSLFGSEWRRVVPITCPFIGRFPRSTTELQVRYMFGGVGLQGSEQPPSDILESASWQSNATTLLDALATQLLTPRGTLIIDGWDQADWCTPQMLFVTVQKLQAGQAHMFSASPQLVADPFVAAAVKSGQLIIHQDLFGEVIEDAVAQGFVNFDSRSPKTSGKIVPIGREFAQLDVSSWNRVASSARPVDVSLLEPFTRASPEITYQRFRNFMGSAEGAPPWRAVSSDYQFERPFHRKLRDAVVAAIEDNNKSNVIVLAGQTGTGKSIACTALAVYLARSGTAPVLYQAKRSDRPQLDDIEAFIEWAEEKGAPPTVLIWDGMADPDEYYTLGRQLRSRGRRIVVVGTTYANSVAGASVSAPAVIDSAERAELRKWLQKFGIETPSPTPGTVLDSSLLAFIYRALPDTEQAFRRGLALELRAAETGIERLVRDDGAEDTRLSVMAQALIDAGIPIEALRPSGAPDAELKYTSFEDRSTTERLASIVLVAGQWGMLVPLDLLLRILGSEGSHRIVAIMRQFDIFRWTEDDHGNQYIGSRTALEAKLLAREDLSFELESNVVVEIIANLKISSDRGGGSEVEFLSDLLEKMGPQSKVTRNYERFFKDWADALAELRVGGIQNVRLALMEANLLREYTQWAQWRNHASSDERLTWLIDCQQLLEAALEDSDTSGRIRLSLYVELASAIGSEVNERTRSNPKPSPEMIVALIGRVVTASLKARACDPENVYPVDVVAWATRDAIKHSDLPVRQRLDLVADAVASLDSVDEESLNPAQNAVFLNRRSQMAHLLDDPEMEAEYLDRLAANQDPAAFYLLARRMESDQGAAAAFDVLDRAPSGVLEDWKCGRLYFETFWTSVTGKRFLSGERNPLPFRREDWTRLLNIIDKVIDGSEFERYRMDFARGMALFHLGELRSSEAVFRDLDRESGGLSNRIRALYLASNLDGSGSPTRYSGRVLRASADGRRGQLWVDQLRSNINFIPQRWATASYRTRDEIVPDFQISFNMRGALAEPIRGGP